MFEQIREYFGEFFSFEEEKALKRAHFEVRMPPHF